MSESDVERSKARYEFNLKTWENHFSRFEGLSGVNDRLMQILIFFLGFGLTFGGRELGRALRHVDQIPVQWFIGSYFLWLGFSCIAFVYLFRGAAATTAVHLPSKQVVEEGWQKYSLEVMYKALSGSLTKDTKRNRVLANKKSRLIGWGRRWLGFSSVLALVTFMFYLISMTTLPPEDGSGTPPAASEPAGETPENLVPTSTPPDGKPEIQVPGSNVPDDGPNIEEFQGEELTKGAEVPRVDDKAKLGGFNKAIGKGKTVDIDKAGSKEQTLGGQG